MTDPAPDPEPATERPGPAFEKPWLRQRWRAVAFLHWPLDPRRIEPLLPDGVRPDTVDGQTWVGLVPFQMASNALGRGPRIPWLGSFPETNVRLYTVDRTGRRGIFFRSLDAGRMVTALGTRWGLGLPYIWSRMSVSDVDLAGQRRITYSCRRRFPGPRAASSRVTIDVGAAVERPSSLEVFLTARWGLHLSRWGRLWYLPVRHPAWVLRRCQVRELDDHLIGYAGLGVSGGPLSALWSPGVDVMFGRPVPVGAGRVGSATD